MSSYKYLGTVIDNAFKFDVNCDMLCKKGQQRLFCLRKLAKFQVDRSLMKMFYCAFIESVRIMRIASKVAGVKFSSLEEIYNTQLLKKAKSISRDETHPLNQEYKLLPSGLRLTVPPATKNRYKFSFVPLSIRALNAKEKRR